MIIIDGDFFESLSDMSFGDYYTVPKVPCVEDIIETHLRVQRTPIFFIETHRISQLLRVVSQVSFDVIIITHNSDISIPINIYELPKNVKKIWSQNYNGEHPLIEPLPIGLERKFWFPEREKQKKILNIHNNLPDKKNLIYCNFDTSTNPVRNQWMESVSKYHKVEKGNNISGNFDDYIRNISEAKFVISPPGNGLDCHRNWEALYCGSVPVISDNLFNRRIFDGLPHILIKNIDNIYFDILDQKDTIYDFNKTKLWGEYWENKIKIE